MKTIIFDLDGTLIDSLPDVQISLAYALALFDYPEVSVSSVKNMVGGGALSLVENAISSLGGNLKDAPAVSDKFKSHYKAHPVNKTTIYPSVLESLSILKSSGFELGICTNKPEATTYPVIEKLNLKRYFGSIICGDTQAYKKPDPRHLLDVIDELGGESSTSVYVGDSETDIEAARAAQVPIILMSYGYAHQPIDELDVDVVLESFSSVPAMVNALLEVPEPLDPAA